MLVSPLLAAYLEVASVSLYVLALFLYLQDRHSSELRVTAMLIFSMGAVALAFASLLWMEVRFAAKTARSVPARMYAERANGGSGVSQ